MFNLKKAIFGKGRREISILSPVEGEVIPIGQVPDITFCEEILGKGIAVLPYKGLIVSPVEGKVAQIFDTGHGISIISNEGVEILIHIGIDTVKLKGEHFQTLVDVNETIEIGAPLIKFDLEAIKRKGYEIVTPIVICNSDEYEEFNPLRSNTVKEGDKILTFQLKEEKRR